MNPGHLFALTPEEKELFRTQPDRFIPYQRALVTEEFEMPSYVDRTSLRLWYNTQAEDYAKHWHDALEIVIPLENTYGVALQEEPYSLEPGDILLIPPGELHAMQAPPSGSRFIFLLDLELFCQLKSFLPARSLLTKPALLTAASNPGIYERSISLFLEIARLYWGDSPSRQLFIYGRMFTFFALFTDNRLPGGGAARPSAFRPADKTGRRMAHLLEYLQTHYADPLTLDEAAERVGVSRYYFTRVFHQYTGQTFGDYLASLRIRAAEDLLRDDAVPVAEIGARCGYASLSAFNRSFRKRKGCSPTAFRRLYQSR